MPRSIATLCVTSALVSTLLASPASAQFEGMMGEPATKSLHVWLGGGLSVPISDAGDTFDTGFHGRGAVTWRPGGLPLTLRADVAFTRFKISDVTTSSQVGVPPPDAATQILSGLGNVTYGFKLGPLRPYVGLGLGAFRVSTDVTGADSTESNLEFGVNGLVGATFNVGRSVSLFLEGRIENIYTQDGQQVDAVNDIQMIPLTFGIMF